MKDAFWEVIIVVFVVMIMLMIFTSFEKKAEPTDDIHPLLGPHGNYVLSEIEYEGNEGHLVSGYYRPARWVIHYMSEETIRAEVRDSIMRELGY